jgi:DNA topoisomerase-1
MPKKYTTTTSLVIVESPAKCKKIEEYLGPGYKCIASFGHLRELPSLKNVDIANNFTPTYTNSENSLKKKQIELIRKEIKKADEVILGCDNDREGSAINFHLCELFNLPLTTKRIIFNEITEKALQTAIKNPTTIDMDMVHAQQTRQILDLLVGFKVTPILWKCIATPKGKDNSLSAGRCQTPALRLIYENEKEIKESKERKVYNTTGYFTNSNLPFELNKQFESEDDITHFLDESIHFKHIYTCEKPVKIFKKPPEPFTTSTIQQVASNELHYSPKETMRICQTLYEGGFITYMRTDSKSYSSIFIDTVKEYIIRNFSNGEKYINENIVSLILRLKNEKEETNNKDNNSKDINSKKEKKNKKENSKTQDAHEAIRPTNISLCQLPETMDSKERRMYKLIWENTLESCMSSASFHSITANITAYNNSKFTYKSEQVEFPGWKIVSPKNAEEIKSNNKDYQYLQLIKQNELIPYKKMISKVSIKGSKLHYTEARLVQLLEERGIGRPSTFSSLVDKIQERGYVKKQDIKGKEIVCNEYELENGEIFEIERKREFGNEKNKLVIQPLGTIVIEFLEKNFNDLFEYNYTSQMEDSLDKIAKGELIWYDLCKNCNNQIDKLIDLLGTQCKMSVKIDENNTYLVGKYGPVIKCVEQIDGKEEITFKAIKNDIDVNNLKNYAIEDIVDTDTKKSTKSSYILGKHDGKDVILKKGKFGLYISWGDNSKTLKELGNRPIENITFDEVKKYLEEGNNFIREINSSLSIRKGSKGDYLFYKTLKMKKPQFYDIKSFIIDTKEDYKICDITILKSWVSEKYNI